MSYIVERCLELKRFHERSKRVRRGVSVGVALILVAVVAVLIRVAMPVVEDSQRRQFLGRFLGSGHMIGQVPGLPRPAALLYGMDHAVTAAMGVTPRAIQLDADAWDHEDDEAIGRYLREAESATIVGQVDVELLEALAALPALKTLTLTNATVTEETAGKFPTFPELRRLELPENGISPDCLTAVGKMWRLEYVRLVTPRLDDGALGQIGLLSHLRSLDIARTNLRQGNLARLAGMANLRSISLMSSRIEPGQLEGLAGSRVQSLTLRGTRLDARGVESLGKMPELEALDLSACGLATSDVVPLFRMPGLRQLDLSSNGGIDDSVVEAFDGRCQLQILQLQGTSVSTVVAEEILQGVSTMIRVRGPDSAWHSHQGGRRR